ncbi:hypothetical protein GGX14DRAFT_380328, partial [Mycena pura]
SSQMKYFWTGTWSISRTLFLMNRYLNPAVSMLALACKYRSWYPAIIHCQPRSSWCCPRCLLCPTVVSNYIIFVLAMLVVRVWYLFGNSRLTRVAMIASFVITNGISLYLAILAGVEVQITQNLAQIHIAGCQATRPPQFWRLWLSPLVLHTVLYCMTAFRAVKNRRMFKEAPILKRLVRDGGFFYFVVFISILFTSIGSFLEQFPLINVPATFSIFPVAATSIAASRVMLSVHSLATKLGSDSAWLLNGLELSRVAWRRGATECELIVDRFPPEQGTGAEDGLE